MKRLFDVIASGLGLIVLSPLFLMDKAGQQRACIL